MTGHEGTWTDLPKLTGGRAIIEVNELDDKLSIANVTLPRRLQTCRQCNNLPSCPQLTLNEREIGIWPQAASLYCTLCLSRITTK